MNEDIKRKLEITSRGTQNIYYWNETQQILNYITNLQEENNLLKAKIKELEEITRHNQKQPKDESEIYNEMFR